MTKNEKVLADNFLNRVNTQNDYTFIFSKMNDPGESYLFRGPIIICYPWYILGYIELQGRRHLGYKQKLMIFFYKQERVISDYHKFTIHWTNCQFEIRIDYPFKWNLIANSFLFLSFFPLQKELELQSRKYCRSSTVASPT